MTSDLDRDLREVFLRHEADLVDAGLAPPDIVGRVRRRQTRTMLTVAFAAIAVAVAGVSIGVVFTRSPDLQPASREEQREPSAAELATRPYFLDLDTGEATLLPENLEGGFSYVPSPDGTRLAYFGSGTGGSIKVATIDGTEVRTLPPPPEGFVDLLPRWSPDGTKIVYQERADTEDDVGNVFVYDFPTGHKRQITDLELTRAFFYDLSPSFSPEGDSILFHLPRSSSSNTKWDVWSVPATGGTPRLILRNAFYAMSNPFPDQDSALYQFLRPSAGDLTGRSIVTAHHCCEASAPTLVEANDGIRWPSLSPSGNHIAYQDGAFIYVLRIATGQTTAVAEANVAEGSTAEWLDYDTLIVTP